MDDDRLITRLRGIDATADPPPQFVDDLHDVLAARLAFPVAEPVTPTRRRPRPPLASVGARRAIPVRRTLLLVAAALLIGALAANAAAIGALVDRLVHGPLVLDQIRASGAVTVAVTADAPQVRSPGGGLDGFDLDVADAIARRLGVRAQVSVAGAAEVLQDPGDHWQVAMPGRGVDPSTIGDVLLTRPYYRWPVYLLGRAGQPVVTELDGATICVVAGSAGAEWLAGAASGPALEVRIPAPRALADPQPDESSCRARIEAGEADAMATSTILPADLATTRTLQLLVDEPVAVEPRAIAVPAQLAGSGALRDALDQAIADLEANGTLADLARSRFGTDSVVSSPAQP